ncbi:zinc ABC transporter substrate-binding protein [Seohaeicola saemankumensis]|nr:zinc ABC transporter substrate-binding protein [Seohaeicola saemankumensis]MCA0869896.1 zinc ABC transporter substrate-binding protein [Seohaeicola saemankumensis]
MIRSSIVLAAFVAFAAPARAEVPRVVADIAPVHALTAQVMQGVGAPELILQPGISPHGYSLRPSQARALQSADLVVWIGEELTPWLAKPLETLAASAGHLALLDMESTQRLSYRDADHEDEGGDDHGDHDEHDDEHDGHDDDHGHAHDGVDPHAWLDPENAQAWLHVIAAELSARDPENAAVYTANAARGAERIAALQADIDARLEGMRGRPFIAFHDAYQYFERRFGLSLAGTVSRGDAADPGPARLAALRDLLGQGDIACAFTEPQLNTRLLETVIEGQGVPVLVLDPMGAGVTPGPALYESILMNMADGFAACGG